MGQLVPQTFADVLDYVRSGPGPVRSATGAVQSVAANVPRLTYYYSTTALAWVLGGLLVEPQRTNLMLNSNDLTLHSSDVGIITTATTITEAATDQAHYKQLVVGGSTAGTVQTISGEVELKPGSAQRHLYVRIIGSTSGAINGSLNLLTGVWTPSGSAPTYSASFGARRLSATKWLWWLTYTPDVSSGPHSLRLGITSDGSSSSLETRVGDGISGLILTNNQIEDGAYYTSRVVTGASQVTRSADIYTKALGAEFNQNAQTVLFSHDSDLVLRTGRLFSWDDGSTANRIVVDATTTGTWTVTARQNGATVGTFTIPASAFTAGRVNKVAIGFDNAALKLRAAVNGTVYEGNLSVPLSAVFTRRRFGSGTAGVEPPGGWMLPFLPHPTIADRFSTEIPMLLTALEMQGYTS